MSGPTTSTLGFALLGLLAREPLSGYDLAARLKERVGFYWHARHSQIYPELARLQAEGLVAHDVVEQHDRPDKKVYTVSDAGRDALRGWVTQSLPLAQTRDELTLKAYSLWLADPTTAAAFFRAQESLHLEQLARYEAFQVDMERECGSNLARVDQPEWATFATLRRGLGYERETAAWCGWVAEQLEQTG